MYTYLIDCRYIFNQGSYLIIILSSLISMYYSNLIKNVCYFSWNPIHLLLYRCYQFTWVGIAEDGNSSFASCTDLESDVSRSIYSFDYYDRMSPCSLRISMEDSCPVFHHWWRHLTMRMLTTHQTWQRLLNNVKIWKVVLHIVYELVRCAWNTPWPQLAVTRWQFGSLTSAAQGQIGTGRPTEKRG